eukprot:GILI01004571.1.p1 GENE.GILI01004571.1~~GILI01004571.1.p1  ORF type:complete len:388 (+),score=78.98 GILI01004571.1:130-1164(+)
MQFAGGPHRRRSSVTSAAGLGEGAPSTSIPENSVVSNPPPTLATSTPSKYSDLRLNSDISDSTPSRPDNHNSSPTASSAASPSGEISSIFSPSNKRRQRKKLEPREMYVRGNALVEPGEVTVPLTEAQLTACVRITLENMKCTITIDDRVVHTCESIRTMGFLGFFAHKKAVFSVAGLRVERMGVCTYADLMNEKPQIPVEITSTAPSPDKPFDLLKEVHKINSLKRARDLHRHFKKQELRNSASSPAILENMSLCDLSRSILLKGEKHRQVYEDVVRPPSEPKEEVKKVTLPPLGGILGSISALSEAAAKEKEKEKEKEDEIRKEIEKMKEKYQSLGKKYNLR